MRGYKKFSVVTGIYKCSINAIIFIISLPLVSSPLILFSLFRKDKF